jgi:hypothetical protein
LLFRVIIDEGEIQGLRRRLVLKKGLPIVVVGVKVIALPDIATKGAQDGRDIS